MEASMNKRLLITTILGLLTGWGTHSSVSLAARPAKHPNILFLITDQ